MSGTDDELLRRKVAEEPNGVREGMSLLREELVDDLLGGRYMGRLSRSSEFAKVGWATCGTGTFIGTGLGLPRPDCNKAETMLGSIGRRIKTLCTYTLGCHRTWART